MRRPHIHGHAAARAHRLGPRRSSPAPRARGRRARAPAHCPRAHPQEDAQLCRLVSELGTKSWTAIAARTGTRSGKSCRLRWHNQLNPEVNKAPFTEWEQAVIIEAQAQEAYTNRWAAISRLLERRTDNAVKNHWHATLKRKALAGSLQNRYLERGVTLDALLASPERQDPSEMAVNGACKKFAGTVRRGKSGGVVKRTPPKRAPSAVALAKSAGHVSSGSLSGICSDDNGAAPRAGSEHARGSSGCSSGTGADASGPAGSANGGMQWPPACAPGGGRGGGGGLLLIDLETAAAASASAAAAAAAPGGALLMPGLPMLSAAAAPAYSGDAPAGSGGLPPAEGADARLMQQHAEQREAQLAQQLREGQLLQQQQHEQQMLLQQQLLEQQAAAAAQHAQHAHLLPLDLGPPGGACGALDALPPAGLSPPPRLVAGGLAAAWSCSLDSSATCGDFAAAAAAAAAAPCPPSRCASAPLLPAAPALAAAPAGDGGLALGAAHQHHALGHSCTTSPIPERLAAGLAHAGLAPPAAAAPPPLGGAALAAAEAELRLRVAGDSALREQLHERLRLLQRRQERERALQALVQQQELHVLQEAQLVAQQQRLQALALEQQMQARGALDRLPPGAHGHHYFYAPPGDAWAAGGALTQGPQRCAPAAAAPDAGAAASPLLVHHEDTGLCPHDVELDLMDTWMI
ncbi:MAG: hypothetical protein J3K34DRAFT_521888 [Monoraphidium minutum]|nr:MAG: hypothetical protein J3K34DRAFT_521888 [Monoraphidium minutum]